MTHGTEDMGAADEYPMTVGRGSGMTLREMNRQISLYFNRKGIPKLELGGGARTSRAGDNAQSPWKYKGKQDLDTKDKKGLVGKFTAIMADAWGML